MALPTFASQIAAIVANGSAVGKAAFRAWGLTVETFLNAVSGYAGVIRNGKLVVSASGNTLTIALKTNAGNDPSASDPVYIAFRDVTLTNGNKTTRAVTAALSLTLTATATFGFVASVASGLTVAFFDNAGTVLIGAINQEAAGVFTLLPVNGIASSTAEGGDGSADSAGTWYTSSALTSKAYAIAGRILWTSGLATAGLWSTPTSVTLKEHSPEALNISAPGVALVASQRGMDLFKCLSADDTGGANSNTAQPWFPTAGGVSVAAGTRYYFEGVLRLSRAAGTTSHTTANLFGGTATLTAIDYLGEAKEGDANDLQDMSGFWGLAATALVLKAASTSATEQIIIKVKGWVLINAAGTFIPQFQYSAAPGGTPTILRGSWFRMVPLGPNATQGTWA